MIFFSAPAADGTPSPRPRKRAGAPVRRRLVSAGTVALAAAVVLGIASTAQAVTGFQAQASSNVANSDFDELDGVTSIGATNATAVGFFRISGTLTFRAFAEHWNGRTWAVVTVPSPAGDDTRLHAVAAATTTDLWAAGSDASRSLFEQSTNGGTSWSVLPSPGNEPASSELHAISAVSPTDIWAVGYSRAGAVGQGFEPLIEHWNGTAWSVVPGAPITATGMDFLTGVSAASTADVWAVGRSGRHSVPIIEHWNGTSWAQVSQPVSGFDSSLNSVAAISGTDVWAVGEQNLNQTVTEHWNGTSWTLVPSPSVTANNAQDVLGGVSAIGSSDVWAAGFSSVLGTGQTLAEHWDGTSWQIVPSANPGAGSSQLSSLAQTAPGGPLRAVGFVTGGIPATATLVETTAG